MKILRNIQSFLGYLAYKNLMYFFLLCIFLVTAFFFFASSSITEPYLFSLSVTRFCIFFILALVSLFSFLVGIRNIDSENYRVAILKASEIRSEINKPGSWISREILSKISDLINETKLTKNPTKLNEFIKKVQKCDQMKKSQKEKRELYKNLPDEINKLDTEVYVLEGSLLP